MRSLYSSSLTQDQVCMWSLYSCSLTQDQVCMWSLYSCSLSQDQVCMWSLYSCSLSQDQVCMRSTTVWRFVVGFLQVNRIEKREMKIYSEIEFCKTFHLFWALDPLYKQKNRIWLFQISNFLNQSWDLKSTKIKICIGR